MMKLSGLLHRRNQGSDPALQPKERIRLVEETADPLLSANRIALVAYLRYIEAEESRNAASTLAHLQEIVHHGQASRGRRRRPHPRVGYAQQYPSSWDGEDEATKSLAHGILRQLPRARVFPEDRRAFGHDDAECSICCNRLVEGVMLVRLPCGHTYHIQCLTPWVGRHSTCPDCRYELPSAASTAAAEKSRQERMKGRTTYRCRCGPSSAHTCFFVDPARSLSDQCKSLACGTD
jgi:Ring finger domain